MRLESEIEKIVFNRLKNALKDLNLIIRTEERWKMSSIMIFDIIIYKEKNPFAIIEIKNKLQNKKLLVRILDKVRSALSITNSRFGIVTDNEKFYLYDRNNKKQDFISISFEQLIDTLINPTVIKSDKEVVLDIIKKVTKKHFSQNEKFLSFINHKLSINEIEFANNSYCFSDSFENPFFIKMMGKFKGSQICRYTSLNTIFEMLNYVSFRMSGLIGMNDKSEVNYVDTYLNDAQKPIDREKDNTIIELNKRYITSCTEITRKDDLTLWRLYSDDAKGVCLVFNIEKDNLNDHIILQKVKYADKSGKHKELDFLKQIKDEVEFNTGFKFDFRKIGVWQHFFKPFDYAIEEEIRLLIIDNNLLDIIKSDFVMTYTHSIINPIIDFRLNSKSFPIQLNKIILGPKCPEQETNLVQLREMIRRKKDEITTENYDSNLNDLKIELSEIKHYR